MNRQLNVTISSDLFAALKIESVHKKMDLKKYVEGILQQRGQIEWGESSNG